ncbi:2-amino-4-hydroxy-6-hydroxymethyldihydropteridine diphosphokinase [Thalassoglobus polymorphus]|uniref:2-amino-4-hydroxy-6-hydroxymethyldihydropteridine pyrophosphokinase n=1 Tax=Thalassoglobus polymorphus TaxID=2527994 RepID=A0A517QPY2_9PLAN|nr:2-amino-4-hydroxy-6-hydroxymethyldihydropteridine diphosphokinase [Thalassoglobus polymorphus]QDT33700.1 Bifunctional folate synthesis protein [Thalassoglobus polymorphus]
MPEALIALGGNLGEVASIMNEAIELLNAHPQVAVTAKSRLYSTQPVGIEAGDPFLNSAVTANVDLEPVELLNLLQQIENQLGRKRSKHWGPRSIDLDLILVEQYVLKTPHLTIPHPACFYRRFVLDPACDVAGEWIHPQFGKSLAELRNSLQVRPLVVAVDGDDSLRTELAKSVDPKIIQIVEPSEMATSLCLTATGNANEMTGGLQVVPLPLTENQVEYAKQILVAATDEPEVLGEF